MNILFTDYKKIDEKSTFFFFAGRKVLTPAYIAKWRKIVLNLNFY